jgi:hypothetical protein
MKGEISTSWYCTVYKYPYKKCGQGIPEDCKRGCYNAHRKWPTPKQFLEEYGEDWRGAVYSVCTAVCTTRKDSAPCVYHTWSYFPQYDIPDKCDQIITVCACTPWGVPPDDWRPK